MAEIETQSNEKHRADRRRLLIFPVVVGVLLLIGWVRLASLQLGGARQQSSVVQRARPSQQVAVQERTRPEAKRNSADAAMRDVGRTVKRFPRKAWRAVRSAIRSLIGVVKGA